jgi:hypothetical protein
VTNWIRECSLTVGSDSSIDLSQQHIKFTIYKRISESPNSAWFRVYNVQLSTMLLLTDKRALGQVVTLIAGYVDNSGPIYQGNIVFAACGREDATNTYVDIYCGDGAQAISHGNASKTFPPGSTQQQHVNYIGQQVFQQFGIRVGDIMGLSDTPYPRAVTLHGPASLIMRNIAHSQDAHWGINDQQLYIRPNNYTGGKIVPLSVETGLIGMPQVTTNGIIFTALILPDYDLDINLQVEPSLINPAAFGLDYAGQTASATLYTELGVMGGNYKVQSIEFRGDTRSIEWYAIMSTYGGLGPIGSGLQAIPNKRIFTQ